jgi:hypothetical protein
MRVRDKNVGFWERIDQSRGANSRSRLEATLTSTYTGETVRWIFSCGCYDCNHGILVYQIHLAHLQVCMPFLLLVDAVAVDP